MVYFPPQHHIRTKRKRPVSVPIKPTFGFGWNTLLACVVGLGGWALMILVLMVMVTCD